MKDEKILVTGATGKQGQAVAKALLAEGFSVRILVREESLHKTFVNEFRELGAQIATGNLDVEGTVREALKGISAVFSVMQMDTQNNDCERQQAQILVRAAIEAGVTQFVHSSVSRTGQHESFPGWNDGRWQKKYWTDKNDVEQTVIDAQFPYLTILRPVSLMENFTQPVVGYLYPHLSKGKLLTAYRPDTQIQLVNVEDLAKFACAAFVSPEEFNQKKLTVASDVLTTAQLSDILSRSLEVPITNVNLTIDEAIAAGLPESIAERQDWGNQVGFDANMQELSTFGIQLTSFEQWLNTHLLPVKRGLGFMS